MIKRNGVASIKYTHDTEAALAELVILRELAHVPAESMKQYIVSREDYGGAADYDYDPDLDCFWRSAEWRCRKSDREIKVTLHRFDELSVQVIEHFGFSCLVCGNVFPYERGKIVGWHSADDIIRSCQSIHCALLACLPCKTVFRDMADGYELNDRLVNGLIDRVLASRTMEVL